MPRADYASLIDSLVRDDADRIDAAQRDDALDRAVLAYAALRPRAAVGGAVPPHRLADPDAVPPVSADTIPASDREAVCALAAASLYEQLAGAYANATEPTIGADSVDWQSAADRYRRLSNHHRDRWREEMGVARPSRAAAAAAVVNPGRQASRREPLTHGRLSP